MNCLLINTAPHIKQLGEKNEKQEKQEKQIKYLLSAKFFTLISLEDLVGIGKTKN